MEFVIGTAGIIIAFAQVYLAHLRQKDTLFGRRVEVVATVQRTYEMTGDVNGQRDEIYEALVTAMDKGKYLFPADVIKALNDLMTVCTNLVTLKKRRIDSSVQSDSVRWNAIHDMIEQRSLERLSAQKRFDTLALPHLNMAETFGDWFAAILRNFYRSVRDRLKLA